MERIRELSLEYPMRVSELVRFLREDGKDFPLEERLLQCAVAVGMACRGERTAGAPEDPAGAVRAVEEIDYILDLAVRAGYLSKLQSTRLRQEGRELAGLLRSGMEREGKKERGTL